MPKKKLSKLVAGSQSSVTGIRFHPLALIALAKVAKKKGVTIPELVRYIVEQDEDISKIIMELK